MAQSAIVLQKLPMIAPRVRGKRIRILAAVTVSEVEDAQWV
jgi:hypothetical protein